MMYQGKDDLEKGEQYLAGEAVDEPNSQIGEGNSLADRVTSSFPISIGTALALETLFNPRSAPYDQTRHVPQMVDISTYSEAWFNLSTMFRNLLGAVHSDVVKTATYKSVCDYLTEDMANTMDLFMKEGMGTCSINFYMCSYKKLRSKYSSSKVVRFREATTANQRYMAKLHDDVMKEIHKRFPNNISQFDSSISSKGIHSKALIFTHIPYDLCSFKNFSQLDLLESHTGVLKPKREWSSKFSVYNTEKYPWLPFHEKLLLIFGDPYLLTPMLPGIRAEVIRIGRAGRWTPMTTLDKVNMDLRDIVEDMVRFIIVAL